MENENLDKKVLVTGASGGIAIKSTTTLKADAPEVYLALTGDQVAITNIKIK